MINSIKKENTKFIETVKIRYSELDCSMTLKPVSLFHFFQDLASDNAEALGFGYSFIIQKNLAWFLLKYRMEFYDYPQNIFDLTIQTEPRGYNKLFAFRNFKVEHDNKLIARVSSAWGLIDLDTKSMANVQNVLEGNPNISPFEKKEDDLEFQKIKKLERVDFKKEFSVRFDELDVNQHVNNANYITYALEPIDFEFRKNYKLKTLDMLFKHELKYGENIVSEVQFEDNKTLHLVKNVDSGDEICLIQAEWVKKNYQS